MATDATGLDRAALLAELNLPAERAEEVEPSAAAAEAWVTRNVAPPADWTPDIALGVLRLAARWYRRRNSLGGFEAITDAGPVYVMSRDPDLAQLLGLGPYAPPRVG